MQYQSLGGGRFGTSMITHMTTSSAGFRVVAFTQPSSSVLPGNMVYRILSGRQPRPWPAPKGHSPAGQLTPRLRVTHPSRTLVSSAG